MTLMSQSPGERDETGLAVEVSLSALGESSRKVHRTDPSVSSGERKFSLAWGRLLKPVSEGSRINAMIARCSLVALAFVVAGCASGSAPADDPSSPPTKQTEESRGSSTSASLPDFELETLDGDSMSLSDHVGNKVILIDFWATFCDPCLVAMPHLNKLYEKYKDDGFIVLGVTIDGPESAGRVRSEVRKAGVTFPILLDPETDALALYNPKTSAPFSILIDKEGNIIKKKEGFTPTDVPALEEAIKGAL